VNALQRLILRIIRRLTRFDQQASATVQATNSDGTYDVILDDGASVAGVEPRNVAPEVRVVAQPGARCLIGWSASKRPYVAAWSGEGFRTEIGGTRPIARVGDPLKTLLPAVVNVNGFVQGIVTTPGGPVPLPPTPFSGIVTVLTAPVGAINNGNPKLLA
jgi:hypothetical protein